MLIIGLKEIKRFIRETSGAIMIAFALMAPVIVGSAGMALDFTYAYLVQQRLQQAIDAAALAAAGASTDEDEINQKIQDFFDANYPEDELGATFVPEVVVDGDQIYVTGNANYTTFFLGLIGVNTISVTASSQVQREIRGLEVVMVLDNTGSMSTNNNIRSLKTAATNFINILFSNTNDPEDVKIGLVPYANSVRIGRYGLGQNPDGTRYADGDVFVNLPAGNVFTNTHSSTDWYGCVIEYESSNYNSTATHVTNSKGQLWRTGTTCSSNTNCRGHGWNPYINTNDPYPDDVLDDYEGPWDIYQFGKVISNGQTCGTSGGYAASRCSSCNVSDSKCNQGQCYCWRNASNGGTNDGCPHALVQPLTSDQAKLLAQVTPNNSAVMTPHGNTLGNIGMVWGSRMISPEPPFEEGVDWDDPYWKKAIVIMTDGDNTENGTYSSFWFTNKNQMTVTKFNQRFEETCEDLKEKGVIIYTVTFAYGINEDTKGYYRRCASSENQYYDAPTQTDLENVFEQIARELSNIYISN